MLEFTWIILKIDPIMDTKTPLSQHQNTRGEKLEVCFQEQEAFDEDGPEPRVNRPRIGSVPEHT